MISDEQFSDLVETRARNPEVLAELARGRKRREVLDDGRGLFLLTADDAARGGLQIGANPVALGNRRRLLERLVDVLAHPAVDGLVATPDIVDDLLLLGALHDVVVFGSMNRSGLAGSTWEVDDRVTSFNAQAVADSGLDGGKLTLRLDWTDPATNDALVSASKAITSLARSGHTALVETLPVVRDTGRTRIAADPESLIRAMSVAGGLGSVSARTWLKVPVVRDMDSVLAATTMPVLIAGGDPGEDRDGTIEKWKRALAAPQARGFIGGRTILFPADGNTMGAVEAVADALGRIG